MTFIHSPNRSDIAIIAAVGEADVLDADRLVERGIEWNPAEAGNIGFDPGVRGLSADDFFDTCTGFGGTARDQVTGDVARRNSPRAQYGDQKVREILTDAGAGVERVDDGRFDLRGALLITETGVDLMGRGFGEISVSGQRSG